MFGKWQGVLRRRPFEPAIEQLERYLTQEVTEDVRRDSPVLWYQTPER
jgi:hypothetical protein